MMESTSTGTNKQDQRPLPKLKNPHNSGGSAVTAKKPSAKDPSSQLPKSTKAKRKANKKGSNKSSRTSGSSPKRAKKSGGNPSPAKVDAASKDVLVASVTRPKPTEVGRHRIRYAGVTFRSRHSKYEARTCRGYDLGLFDLACDAALACDVAHRIAGGNGDDLQQTSPLITNDVEEIKYALNWLDLASDEENGRRRGDETAGGAGTIINFTSPSSYREARGKEIGDYLAGNIHYPTFNLKNVPQEEELKKRIKMEILNLARAYVAATNEGLNVNDHGGESESIASNDEAQEREEEKDKKNEKAVSSLLKKKTWAPEGMAGEDKMVADRREQAEALLSLQRGGAEKAATAARQAAQASEALLALHEKSRHSGTRDGASVRKPQKTTGEGGNVHLAVSSSSSSPSPRVGGSEGIGATARSSSFPMAGLTVGDQGGSYSRDLKLLGNTQLAKKSPEANDATKNNSLAVELNDKKALLDDDSSSNQPQLHQLKLQQQQALDALRTAADPFGSVGDSAGRISLLPNNALMPPNGNNSALEQVMLLAAQRPDIRRVIQEQQSRGAAAMIRAAQSQAPHPQGGPPVPSSLSSNFGLRLPGPASTLSSNFGPPPPSLVSSQSHQPTGQHNLAEEKEKPQPSRPCAVQPTSTSKSIMGDRQECSAGATNAGTALPTIGHQGTILPPEATRTVTALLANMGHQGTIPPGLAEQLQAALNQQQYGEKPETAQAASVHDRGRVHFGGGEDPQVILQRKWVSEENKALAERLSTLISGDGGGSDDGQGKGVRNMENEKGQIVGGQCKGLSEKVAPKRSMFSKQTSLKQNANNRDDHQAGNLNQKKRGLMKKESERDTKRPRKQAGKDSARDTAAFGITPAVAKSLILKSGEGEEVSPQPHYGKGNVIPENTASSDTIPLQQPPLPSLQALQALQQGLALSGEQGSAGVDEQTILQGLLLKKQMEEMNNQALEHKAPLQQGLAFSTEQGFPSGMGEQNILQSLLLKKQMDEMNKHALEQKAQDYIQGTGGIPQQALSSLLASASSGLNLEQLSQNIALQSLLSQEGGASCAGAQQGLAGQPSDLARQVAVQTILAANQDANRHISDALTHDAAHRRFVMESMLASEENRLRQLREALQSQLLASHPQQLTNQIGAGSGGFGHVLDGNVGQFDGGILNELALQRERAVSAANEELRRAALAAEINASAAERQAREVALRQALTLRASQQGAGVLPEGLLEVARSHGLDPRTMTPGQLAQLMGMAGLG